MILDCPECSAKVSDAAFSCPQCGKLLRKPEPGFLICPECGKPFRKLKRSFFGNFFKWALIVFNLVTLFLGILNLSNHSVSQPEIGSGSLGYFIYTVQIFLDIVFGLFFILLIWAVGNIILLLLVWLTRPR
jgi:hypothetical protein